MAEGFSTPKASVLLMPNSCYVRPAHGMGQQVTQAQSAHVRKHYATGMVYSLEGHARVPTIGLLDSKAVAVQTYRKETMRTEAELGRLVHSFAARMSAPAKTEMSDFPTGHAVATGQSHRTKTCMHDMSANPTPYLQHVWRKSLGMQWTHDRWAANPNHQ